MGKAQSKGKPSASNKDTSSQPKSCTSIQKEKSSTSVTAKKDLVISYNSDFTEVDVQRVRRASNGNLGKHKRRASRMDKLKSRKLPHTLKIQIVEEVDLEATEHDEDHHKNKSSDHHMSHLEKIKRRKMPAGKRIFGEHYNE